MSAMEYTHATEAAAKRQRRGFIAEGHLVSLIGFDTSRDLYAFDVVQDDHGPTVQGAVA